MWKRASQTHDMQLTSSKREICPRQIVHSGASRWSGLCEPPPPSSRPRLIQTLESPSAQSSSLDHGEAVAAKHSASIGETQGKVSFPRMEEDEPEPCPGTKCIKDGRYPSKIACEAEIKKHMSKAMQAHFQMLQLSADVAGVSCGFSSCAPLFFRLAERAKSQVGTMMDTVIAQGGVIELPAITTPCPNLAMDHVAGEQTLTAAIEACLQLESSKGFEALAAVAQRKGASAATRKMADALASESHTTHSQLMRTLSAIACSASKMEAMTYAKSLID